MDGAGNIRAFPLKSRISYDIRLTVKEVSLKTLIVLQKHPIVAIHDVRKW